MSEMEPVQLPSQPIKCMAFLMRAFKNVRRQLSIKEEMFLHSARSCSIFLATQVFLRAIEADTHTQEWATTITWSKVVQPRNVQDRFKVSLRIVSPSSTTNMLFKLVLAESIHLVLNTSDLTKALPQPQETTVSSVVQPPANQDQETKRRRTSKSSLTTSMEEVSRLKVQGHQPKSRLPLKSIQTTSRNIKTFKTSNTCNINNIWKTVRINRCISELVQCMEKVPTIRRHLLWCKLKLTLMPLVASCISNTWSKSQKVRKKSRTTNSNKLLPAAWFTVLTASPLINPVAWWACLLLPLASPTLVVAIQEVQSAAQRLPPKRSSKYPFTTKQLSEVQFAQRRSHLPKRSKKSFNTPIPWRKTLLGTEKSYLRMMILSIIQRETRIERGERHVSRRLF